MYDHLCHCHISVIRFLSTLCQCLYASMSFDFLICLCSHAFIIDVFCLRLRSFPNYRLMRNTGSRVNVITSFFLVKKLAGALSLGTSALPTSVIDIEQLLTPKKQSDDAAMQRQHEYIQCILRNAACKHVGKIFVLMENPLSYIAFRSLVLPQLSGSTGATMRDARGINCLDKVIPFLHTGHGQPTYADLFRFSERMAALNNASANKQTFLTNSAYTNCTSAGCDVHMVCNSDVYINDHSFDIDFIMNRYFSEPQGKNALALTRTEDEQTMLSPLIDEFRGSHDAFIYAPIFSSCVSTTSNNTQSHKVPSTFSQAFYQEVDHPQNCYQAENVVVYALEQEGFVMANPCRRARLFHLHEADVRQWFPSRIHDQPNPACPSVVKLNQNSNNNPVAAQTFEEGGRYSRVPPTD